MADNDISFGDMFRTVGNNIKAALASMIFNNTGGSGNWPLVAWPQGNTNVKYNTKVELTGSSIIMACIGLMQRTFPEATPVIEKLGVGGEVDEVIQVHPLLTLLRKPNPFYSGSLLFNATIQDWMANGNAYWICPENSRGTPLEAWWAPNWMMEPKWPEGNNKVFISHYEYTVNHETRIKLPVEQVVHFRYGLDPRNPRKGLSPVGVLLREIFTDNEAANWTAQLLGNGAVPGLIVTPDGENVRIAPEEAEAIKAMMAMRFGGDRRGETAVSSHPVKVQQVSWSPDQMNYKDLRRVPEERATAVMGTPAVIVGLGVGLEHSIYNNVSEAREHFYEGTMIPAKSLIAEDLGNKLLPKYFGETDRYRIGYDYTKVRVLQEDQDKLHARARSDLTAGGILLDEFREMIGMPPLDKDMGRVFYLPNSITVVKEEELIPEPLESIEGELVNPPIALPPGREPEDDDEPTGAAPTETEKAKSELDDDIETKEAPTEGSPLVSPLSPSLQRKPIVKGYPFKP